MPMALNTPTMATGTHSRYVFKVAQFHFRWGGNDTHGFKHTNNGHRYPLEVSVQGGSVPLPLGNQCSYSYIRTPQTLVGEQTV